MIKKILFILSILILSSYIVNAVNEFDTYRMEVYTSGANGAQIGNGWTCNDAYSVNESFNEIWNQYNVYATTEDICDDSEGWDWAGWGGHTPSCYNATDLTTLIPIRPYYTAPEGNGAYIDFNLTGEYYCREFRMTRYSTAVWYILDFSIRGRNGTGDWVTLINDTMTANDQLFTNPFNGPIVGDPSFIVVTNGTVNLTSDGGEWCGFDGTYNHTCGPTNDSTPTFQFNTDGDATCKLYNLSSNYTTLDGLGVSNCGTTGTSSHICTFPEPLNHTLHELFVSCSSGPYEMNDFPNSNIIFTDVSSCRCPDPATNWELDLIDLCNINASCDISGYNISYINTGAVTFNNTIQSSNIDAPPAQGTLWIGNSCLLNITSGT